MTTLRIPLIATLLTLLAACFDFGSYYEPECEPGDKESKCPPGKVCWADERICVPACKETFDCEDVSTACIDGACIPYTQSCDPGAANANAQCHEGYFCGSGGSCRRLLLVGEACTDVSECHTDYCIDGFCCMELCDATCYACSAELTGGDAGICTYTRAGMARAGECAGGLTCNGAGSCSLKANGENCLDGAECETSTCVDGVCCDAACSAFCESCVLADTGIASGICGAILAGEDPTDDCPAHLACSGTRGVCFDLGTGDSCSNDYECLSGHCVDNVCCETACDGICQACTAALNSGAATDGTCAPIPNGSDPQNECTGALGCNGSSDCITGAANGVSCGQDSQCASGFCVDNVCCATSCNRTCEACTSALNSGAAPDGTCAPIPYLEDPEGECAGGFGCSGSGTCNPVKTWQPPELIENESGDARGARVAMNSSGEAVAVWVQDDGTYDNARTCRFTPAGGWGSPELLENRNDQVPFVRVGMASSGDAVSAWSQRGASSSIRLWGNDYDASVGGWGTPSLIDLGDLGTVQNGSLAMSSGGFAAMVWRHAYQGVRSTWAVRYTPGQGWGSATLLETSDLDVREGDVAINSIGDAVAVWTQDDGAADSIWASVSTETSGWSTATVIEADTANNAYLARVAMNDAGNATAIWSQFDGVRWNLWANRLVAGSGWSGATVIDAGDGSVWAPEVAIDSDGNSLAVWAQDDATDRDLYAARHEPGVGWSSPVALETRIGNVANPEIMFDDMGNATAVWRQASGAAYDLWTARFVRGAWSTPALIDSSIAYFNLAVGREGRAMAVWTKSDGTRENVWASRFE